MQILIVDDNKFHLKVLERALAQLGHTAVPANGGEEALDILRHGEIHLVITDWEMPGMDGLDLCRTLRQEDFNGYVYLIMLTGHEGAKSRREGLAAGADAFLNKPLEVDELEVCIKMAERILALETRDVALFALAKLAESRDPEIGGHIERVQSYSRHLAQHLSPKSKELHGVDAEYIRLIFQTSPLHDLGKVAIPDGILLKPGKLTAEEFEIMKTHTTMGAQTLDAALQRFPNVKFLQFARDIVISHHERFDGTGYPASLEAEQIPFCGRIVAVADVYDALTSRRVYKEAMSHEQASEIIRAERGRQLDPDVIDSFVQAENEILAVQARLKDDVPLGTTDDKTAPMPQSTLAATERPCGILIVEDSPVMQKVLVNLLAGTGEPIFAAGDAAKAMAVYTKQHPGLVVSDLELGGPTGADLCRRIRSVPTGDPIHFIMVTRFSDQNSKMDAYRAGVDDFIEKPFNSDELVARVRAGLRTWRLHEELSRKTSNLQEANLRLTQMNGRLDRLSITDDLTGLFNRRHAMVRLEEQWALAERYGRFLTVGMLDIDQFKNVNDKFGHDVGDIVLRRVAGILRDQTRGTDAVCRIGGEEFLIIFPSETAAEALACCQRCRAAVEAHQLQIGCATITVTISAGVATRAASAAQFPDLLRDADKALYSAKKAGRNCVRSCDDKREDSTMPASKPDTGECPTSDGSLGDAKLNWNDLLARCGGDAGFAVAVAKRFAAQGPLELANISQSLKNQDAELLRRAAHTLKSMVAYVSADAAAQTCAKIEELAKTGRIGEVPMFLTQLEQQIKQVVDWIALQTSAPQALSA